MYEKSRTVPQFWGRHSLHIGSLWQAAMLGRGGRGRRLQHRRRAKCRAEQHPDQTQGQRRRGCVDVALGRLQRERASPIAAAGRARHDRGAGATRRGPSVAPPQREHRICRAGLHRHPLPDAERSLLFPGMASSQRPLTPPSPKSSTPPPTTARASSISASAGPPRRARCKAR